MTYSSWLGLGLLGGLGLAALSARRRGLAPLPVIDTALAALAAGVLGARAGYVGLHWDYFQEHIPKAVQWWRGGLNWHAGFIAGLIAAILYMRRRQLPASRILDAGMPGLAWGCCLGWLACLAAHCAYGAPVWPEQAWWALAADWPDAYGIAEPRIAVQALGAAWTLLVGLGLLALERIPCLGQHPPGVLFAAFVGVASAGMCVLGFARGDDTLRLNGLRLDQAADAVLAVAGVLYVGFQYCSRINTNKHGCV